MAAFALSAWIITLVLGAVVFVPLFVIALVRLPSVRHAFLVSACFSMGAMAGFFVSFLLASLAIPRHLDAAWNGIPGFIFVSAGAVGGAALAVALLRRYMR